MAVSSACGAWTDGHGFCLGTVALPAPDDICECPCHDEFEEQEVCECELDWSCGLHSHLPTPEDRLATHWSQDHP